MDSIDLLRWPFSKKENWIQTSCYLLCDIQLVLEGSGKFFWRRPENIRIEMPKTKAKSSKVLKNYLKYSITLHVYGTEKLTFLSFNNFSTFIDELTIYYKFTSFLQNLDVLFLFISNSHFFSSLMSKTTILDQINQDSSSSQYSKCVLKDVSRIYPFFLNEWMVVIGTSVKIFAACKLEKACFLLLSILFLLCFPTGFWIQVDFHFFSFYQTFCEVSGFPNILLDDLIKKSPHASNIFFHFLSFRVSNFAMLVESKNLLRITFSCSFHENFDKHSGWISMFFSSNSNTLQTSVNVWLIFPEHPKIYRFFWKAEFTALNLLECWKAWIYLFFPRPGQIVG